MGASLLDTGARLLDRSECERRANKPESNTELRSGRFWRNVEEVKWRYPNDQSWGKKFDPQPRKWQGWKKSQGIDRSWLADPGPVVEEEDGLSVSLAGCTCANCARQFHPDPGRYKAVTLIDLDKVSEVVKCEIVAGYRKTEQNPCHYVLIPRSARIDDFYKRLEELCKWPDKPPSERQDTAQFQTLMVKRDNWRRIFVKVVEEWCTPHCTQCPTEETPP